ncbi:MAG: helix-turn-helix domain-containing protein [Chakrabartia sp.]
MTKRKSALDGLKVTVTYVGSGNSAGRQPRVKVPPVNVAALRAKTGLSQFEFAQSIGVPKGTLFNWEQGRREPTGPAQVLLAILAKKPSLVKDLFANKHLYQPQPDRAWLPGGPHPDDMTPEARWAEILQILNTARTRLQAKTGDADGNEIKA